MVLEHMNYRKTQAQVVSALDNMIVSGELVGHLKAFLISCKVEELSPATIKDYEQKIGAFVRYCTNLDIRQPEEVNVRHIRLFLLKLQERCNANSIHDYYGCVKRFFNWLISEGVLNSNPMASMRSPRVPKKIIIPFSITDISDMLLLCDDGRFLGARNKAIILTFIDTGLRLSELASIQLNDIDFDRELIKVMGKGSRERVVGIGKLTQKAILKYLLMRKDSLPCLWVTEEFKPMKRLGIQIMIRRLCKRAEIRNARGSPHTFRHTFGTLALLNGASEREVQSLLGHSTQRMTQRYTATINSEHAIKGYKRFSPVDNIIKK